VVHSTPLSEISMQRFLSVLAPVPMRQRWLESGKALALREPLAAPLTFAATFCERQEKFPPSAANAKEFRAHARPQPSEDTPACPTSPIKPRTSPSPNGPSGGRTSGGRIGRLRSSMGSKLLKHRPPEAGTLLFSLLKAATNFNRPANGVRSARALPDSSQRRSIGTKTIIDKNLILYPYLAPLPLVFSVSIIFGN